MNFNFYSPISIAPDMSEFSTNLIRFLLNWAARNLLTGVVVFCCSLAIIYYNYWFTWHIILCTLGMIPLMTEALMLFPRDELWSKQLTRKQKYWIHGSLFILGTTLVSAGCIDTFYFIEPGYHLYTVHGITGLVGMILFIVSIFLGILADGSHKLAKYGHPVVFKSLHNSLGLLGYVISGVSLCTSYYTNWFVFYTSAESRLVALIATVVAMLWSMNGSLISLFNQVRSLKSLLGK